MKLIIRRKFPFHCEYSIYGTSIVLTRHQLSYWLCCNAPRKYEHVCSSKCFFLLSIYWRLQDNSRQINQICFWEHLQVFILTILSCGCRNFTDLNHLLRWLDQTPTSRILARCTQDIRTIDTRIAQSLMWVISQSLGALFKLCIVAFLTPASFFPAVGIGLLGIWIGNLYLKAQLSVKRELRSVKLWSKRQDAEMSDIAMLAPRCWLTSAPLYMA